VSHAPSYRTLSYLKLHLLWLLVRFEISPNNEIDTALVGLLIVDCIPKPLDGAFSTFSAYRGSRFWDSYIEVDYAKNISFSTTCGIFVRGILSSRSGPGLFTGHASHVFSGLPRTTLLTGSIRDTFYLYECTFFFAL
jgi:hypothetical protein